MTREELDDLIDQWENAKVDFKRQWYWNDNTQNNIKEIQKNELVKDLIALTNGDIYSIDKTAYLIIGIDDSTKEPYNFDKSAILPLDKLKQQLLTLLNNYAQPEFLALNIELLDEVLVISVPPRGSLISLSKNLQLKNNNTDRKGTTYYRVGEDVHVASSEVIIEFEKALRSDNQNIPTPKNISKREKNINVNNVKGVVNAKKGATINQYFHAEKSNKKYYYIFGSLVIIGIFIFWNLKHIEVINENNSPNISTTSEDVSTSYATFSERKEKSLKIELLSKLDILGVKKAKYITKKEISSLLNTIFIFGDDDNSEAIIVKLDSLNNDYSESVVNCRRYNLLLNKGYTPSQGIDMKLASKLNRSCETLKYLLRAEKASKSYIQPLTWNRETLKFLPMDITKGVAMSRGPNEVADEKLKNIYDLNDRVEVINQYESQIKTNINICFEVDELYGICLEPMAKADVNQDGIEDLIVFMGVYAVGGTYSYGNVIVLTRYDNEGIYQILD